jgi:hypothetical protein
MATNGRNNDQTGPYGDVRNNQNPSNFPTQEEQINNRMKANGFIPDIDYDRLGQVMQRAFVSALNETGAGKTLGQPRATGTGRQRVPEPGRKLALGVGGLRSNVAFWAARKLWTGPGPGPFGAKAPAPGAPTYQTPTPVPGTPQAQPPPGQATYQAAQATEEAPEQAPTAPQAPAGPWEAQPGGGQAWVGYPNVPREAPQLPPAPLGGGPGNAVGEATSAAEAATTATTGPAGGGGGIRNALSQALAGYGGAGGTSGGIRGAWEGFAAASPDMAAALTPIGWGLAGVTAGYEGLNMLASQRQLGAYWQGILGGTNLQGQEQRFQQGAFRFSQLGNLSGAQANALFQGVTNLDMTGPQRQNAMQQAVQMYDQLGVSIQTSLQNITIAAQNGNRELVGLADAITNVTNAATGAQVSGNVARGIFSTNYGAATGVLQGPGATAVASGVSAAQVGLGPQFQNQNFTPLFSQQAMQFLAGTQHMGLDQFIGQIQSGHPGVYGAALRQFAQQYLPTGQINQYLTAGARQLGYTQAMRRGQLTPQQLSDLSTYVMTNDPAQIAQQIQATFQGAFPGLTLPLDQAMQLAVASMTGNFAPNTAQPRMRQYSIGGGRGQIAPTQANLRTLANPPVNQMDTLLQTYVRQNYGQYTPAEQQTLLQEGRAAIQQMSTAAGRARGLAPGAEGIYEGVRQMYQRQFVPNAKTNAQISAAAKAIGDPNALSRLERAGEAAVLGPLSLLTGLGRESPSTSAKDWYLQHIVTQQRQRDPVMEQILGNANLNNPNTIFSVQTRGGKTTYATAQDLEEHYMNAVQAGQVTVASSDDASIRGRNLQEILNFRPTSTYAGHDVRRGNDQTRLANQVKTAQAAQARAAAQVITVKPTQALLNWMTFESQSSGINIEGSPTATNSTAPAYPVQSTATPYLPGT